MLLLFIFLCSIMVIVSHIACQTSIGNDNSTESYLQVTLNLVLKIKSHEYYMFMTF